MIVAGHQPNYMPWLGFFDKMAHCDIFIIEDNIQFSNNGFTNRNKIKTREGARWLTVPIEHVGGNRSINQIVIANKSEPSWAKRHWLGLQHAYNKAPFWGNYSDFFEQTFSQKWNMLIDLNMHLIRGIMRFLEIETPLVMASSLQVEGQKSELILAQCKAIGANVQLSGAGSRGYLNVEMFKENGIEVVFQDFRYPTYPQLHNGFYPNLSVVDYLFCTGGVILEQEAKRH
jgi:hypothetical protein